MAFWERVREFLTGLKDGIKEARAPGTPGPLPPAPPERPAQPVILPGAPAPAPGTPAAAEQWLAELIADVADGDATAIAGVATPEFWSLIDLLGADGHDRLAAEWLDKFAAATPDGEARDAVRVRAVDLRAERGELREALPHLEVLIERPTHAAKAHFLLGELHRRAGDTRRALRHFEAVLAVDVEYPNARVRVEALRAQLGDARSAVAAVDDTIAGVDGRGAVTGARYRLVRELGRGACGAVYLARDAELERDVAVKLLHPHLAASAQAGARARFFDEARVAAALRHPNIVAILDLDEPQRRIVMELAAGGTLKDRLRAGPLPPEAALRRHVEVLSALAAAHRQGVVHRDLKPANLLFRRDPDAPDAELVLADFGIAHLAPATPDPQPPPSAGRRHADHEAVGTLGYMAPEQRRGDDVDPRADLYAAGVILYETLAGLPPWDRDRELRGLRASGDMVPPPRVLDAVGPDVAEPLTRHLIALGDPDPARRPGTSEALAAAAVLVDLLAAGDELRQFREQRAELLRARE